MAHPGKYLIFLGLFVFFQACEVATLNEENDPALTGGGVLNGMGSFPATVEELETLLAGGTSREWTPVGFTIEGLTGSQPCRMDDNIQLNANGTYTYDGGPELCGAEDDTRIKSGSWSINFVTKTILLESEQDGQFTLTLAGTTADEVAFSGSYFGLEVLARYKAVN